MIFARRLPCLKNKMTIVCMRNQSLLALFVTVGCQGNYSKQYLLYNLIFRQLLLSNIFFAFMNFAVFAASLNNFFDI